MSHYLSRDEPRGNGWSSWEGGGGGGGVGGHEQYISSIALFGNK